MAVVSLPLGLHRKQKATLAGLSFLLAYVIVRRQQTRAKRRARRGTASGASGAERTREGSQGKPRRVGVDRHFVEQFKKLLPICIPSLASKEAGLLAILASILIARYGWLYPAQKEESLVEQREQREGTPLKRYFNLLEHGSMSGSRD